jgi:hypothetical protein
LFGFALQKTINEKNKNGMYQKRKFFITVDGWLPSGENASGSVIPNNGIKKNISACLVASVYATRVKIKLQIGSKTSSL